MASALNSDSPLLDLSFLTEEEREKIETVLKEDQELRIKDRIRLGTLRQQIEQERTHQKVLVGKRQCTSCEKPLGRFFNTGAICPVCGYRVCKTCRRPNQSGKFMCLTCNKNRLLNLQAKDYMSDDGESKMTQKHSGSTASLPDVGKLYGSELVQMSLEVVNKNKRYSWSPQRFMPRPSSASVSSSIVVKYVDKSSDDDHSTTSEDQPQPVSTSARKLSLSELSDMNVNEEDEQESPQEMSSQWKVLAPVPNKQQQHLLTRSDSMDSFASMTSMYSAAGGKGNYDISGDIQLGVWYKDGQLFIRVVRAKHLTAVKKMKTSDPYVKTYLLPDRSKHTKRKTAIQRKTVNPYYNEILKYKVEQKDISSHTLWVSVWDWDRFGRNQFLGEVRLPLSSLDLTDSTDNWYTLQDKDTSVEEDEFYRGRVNIALKCTPETAFKPGEKLKRSAVVTLHIAIKEAEELPIMDPHGLTDATVKIYLLPNRHSNGKRKTRVVKNNLNPVWNEEFEYKHLVIEELVLERVLEVTMWDYDRRGSNDFIGGLRLGPAPGSNGGKAKHKEWIDSIGDEVSHWEAMLAHPGEWVEQWHNLRPSMDPLKHGSRSSSPRSPKRTELSPVKELSPTQELEVETSTSTCTPVIVEGFAFTPPASPVDLTPVQQEGVESVKETTPSLKEPSPIPEVIITDEEEIVSYKGSIGDQYGSMASVYSAAGGKGDYDIIGEVLVGVHYKDGQLLVHVNRARGLAAADSNGYSDPYVKTYLLPDKSKHSKKKTDIKKKTLNPVYDQTLKYVVSSGELNSRTLLVSVWDWDRFGRNQFLGEVRLPLSSLDLTDSTDNWYTLQDKDTTVGSSDSHIDPFYHGELLLGLKFEPTDTKKGNVKGTFTVAIERASNLPKMDATGTTDAFIKCYLLPDKSHKGKRKTDVVKDNLNPVWEERFSYEKVSMQDLESGRVLEVTVWDFNKGSSSDFIGGLRLGPAPGRAVKHKEWMDSIGDEVTHWEAALARPGEWVEQWHTLRTSMDPRDVDLSIVPPSTSAPAVMTSTDPPELNLEEEFKKITTQQTQPSTLHVVPLSSSAFISSSSSSATQSQPIESSTASENESKPATDSKETPKDSVKSIPSTLSKEDHEEVPLGPSVGLTDLTKMKEEQIPSQVEQHHHHHDHDEGQGVTISVEQTSPATEHRVPTSVSSQTGLSSHKKSPLVSKSSPMLGLKRFDSGSTLGSTASFGSMASVYSAAGGKGDYDIIGEVLVGVHYKDGQLLVHVNRARGLAAADSNGYSDPYVKTYLLPDKSKHSKKKTSVKRKTVNPVYGETLKYKMAQADLDSRTLWVSVWDWDRFGRNQFLGEVRLPLSSLDLTDSTDKWYTLQDKDESAHGELDSFYRGEIKIGLKFDPSGKKGSLHLLIKQAKELPLMDSTGLTNAVVKTYLLPDRHSRGKRKTEVIKNNVNPVWEEKFKYENVSLMELSSERYLEVTVWDHDKSGNDFIGGLRLGPAPGRAVKHKEWMDSIGDEVTHWEAALAHPGEWVEEWHTLRPSMDPRDIDHSSLPPLSPLTVSSKQEQHTIPTPPAVDVTHPPATTSEPLSLSIEDEFKKVSQTKIVHEETSSGSPVLSLRTRPDIPATSSKQLTQEVVKSRSHESSLRYTREDSPTIKIDDESSSSVVVPESHSTPVISESHESQEHQPQAKHHDEPLLKKTSLLGLKRADSATSFGSMASVYSAAGGKGDYDIIGEVLVGVHYKDGQLLVHVNRARGLAAADSNGYSDPYVKTYLLPDKSKHSKKKTDIKKKTLNPVYDQTLKYKVSRSDLNSRTLWVSVWDWDRFGRNQFLGEVRLPLSSLDLTDSTDNWYTLQDKDEDGPEESYRGQLHVALMYSPHQSKKDKKPKGTLNIVIKQARDLPKMESTKHTDAFIKCYLLPDKSTSGKRKTSVIKNNLNPVWEEPFTYEKIHFEELSNERVLEIVVWDFNKGSSSDFIGGLRLGPAPGRAVKHKEWMDSIGDEVTHWEAALARPGEWVEQWHTLRTSMDPRSVAIL